MFDLSGKVALVTGARRGMGAADAKASVRVEIDRSVAGITTLVKQARARLATAERVRAPSRLLEQPAGDLAAAETVLQKAGEAIKADDYLTARTQLEGVKSRIEAALKTIDTALAPPAARRRS